MVRINNFVPDLIQQHLHSSLLAGALFVNRGEWLVISMGILKLSLIKM